MNKKKAFFTSKLDINLRKKVCDVALHGVET